MAIELNDEFIELERAAWAEQQENRLTVDTAAPVQAATTAHAQATGQSRCAVERSCSACSGTRTTTDPDTWLLPPLLSCAQWHAAVVVG
ncbi:hypothetical protein ACFWVP_00695 [Streptomyces sp. NPDC058637]|uniref:hypothetical protein n=1 Tax=Streptomyces sp. NPDC058637 TaxID=3346569 RepID=UPI003646562E